MSGFDVTSSELSGIAASFGTAAQAFDKSPSPPPPPDAGASSAAVSAMLSRVSAALGDVESGLTAAGTTVGRCHTVYRSCDADGAGLLDSTMPFGGPLP